MAAGVLAAGGGNSKAAAGSSAINNPQVFQDILTGLQAFQANQVVSPAQRAALDEQIALRGKINDTFSQLGMGARNALIQQFGTQMKNLKTSDQLRGLAGSSLAATGQVGLEGQRQKAIGDLENSLINAQANAIVDLSGDFAGTLSEASDQNAAVFASLMNLLRPQVTASQYVSAAQSNAQQAFSSAGGGGGGGGRSKKSSDGGGSGVPYFGPGGAGAGFGKGALDRAGAGDDDDEGGDGGGGKQGKTFSYSPTKPLIKAGKK